MFKLQGLSRPLVLFLLHSAIFHIGLFGITDVVLNFYFVSLGYDSEVIGFLQGISRVGGIFTGIPIGILADRIGARRVIIYSMVGSALSYLPMLVMPSLPILIFSRVLFGISFGAAFIAAGPLMIALVSREHQSHAFGYYQITTLTATAFGSFLGGFLPRLIIETVGMPQGAALEGVADAQTPFAYGAALFISALISLASVLPVLRLPDRAPTHAAPTVISEVNAPPTFVPWRAIILLSIPSMLFGLTAGLTFPFYNLFFRTRFTLPDEQVGAILSIGWLMMGVVGATTPWWERRFGRVRALLVSMSLAAVAYVALGFSQVVLLGALMFMLAASVRNLLVPLYEPLRLEYVPKRIHNLSSAVGSVLWSMGWFASSSLSGVLQRDFGFDLIFSLVAVLLILTAISIAIVFRKPPPKIHEGTASAEHPEQAAALASD